ncbi:MAG TPA: DUF4097 family beta strand repeat-containing protein [Pyrinomonadaceae bacterium]|nr:DUF4097 family beta strand repeat-containing protein [Pyrinomonadaceae bacterium]
MSKMRWVLGLAALAALLAAAPDGARARQERRPELSEEFHQSYPLSAGGRVSLSNINGDVRVTAWDRDEVKIDAVKRAYKQERLREAEIRVSAEPGHVAVETKYPEYRYHRDSERSREDNPASVEYTLTVPRGARLREIKLINGSLDIEGVSGAVDASSINGRVTAKGLTGRVNLSVINGTLEAAFDRLAEGGSVTLSSVNGPVSVTLPSDANAVLRASTVHGAISNDFNLPVRAGEYVGRNLEGRLGSGGADVRVNNVNGTVQLRRANDNRAPSPVTNLLSETRGRKDFEGDEDGDEEAGEAEREAREELRKDEAERAREIREAVREAREAAREGERAAREAAREARQEVKENLMEHSSAEGAHGRRLMERESNSIAVSGSPAVHVETFDGSVSVHAWDKPEVAYTAIKRAAGEREMKGIRVVSSGGGSGEVRVRAEFDKSQASEYVERDGRVVSFNSGASVELDVYVPRNSALFVSSGDGRIRVEGVSGELTVNTGDGSIDVSGGAGRLRATTGDGAVRVADFEGEADARTGDGRITLDGRFRKLSARTGDGTISLTIPADASFTIETDAESVVNDGFAVSQDPGEGRVRRWRVGSGGEVFSLRTGDGHVILRRR